MLLINPCEGQTCNQLWSYAVHCFAKAQLKIDIRYLPIAWPIGLQIHERHQLPERLLFSKHFLAALCKGQRGTGRLRELIDYRGRSYDLRSNRIFVLDNWNHLPILLNLVEDNSIRLHDYVSLKSEATIGGPYAAVHARQSDYKNFANGRYWRSPLHYIQLCNALHEKTHLPIVLFTDDRTAFEQVKLPDFVTPSPGKSMIDDLMLMSRAELICGPISTFSMTASNLGKTPLHWLFDDNWLESISIGLNRTYATGFYRLGKDTTIFEPTPKSYKLTKGKIPTLLPVGRGLNPKVAC